HPSLSLRGAPPISTRAARTAAGEGPTPARTAVVAAGRARGGSERRAGLVPGPAEPVGPAPAAPTPPAVMSDRTGDARPVAMDVRGVRTARAATTGQVATSVQRVVTARLAMSTRLAVDARIAGTVRAGTTVGRTAPVRRLARTVPSSPASRTASPAASW